MTRGPCCGRRSRHKVLAATRRNVMPKAYWVVTYRSVKNPAAWKAYAKLAEPATEGAGGRFLARSNPTKVYESGMNERGAGRDPQHRQIRPPTRRRSRRSARATLNATCALLKAPPDRVSPIGERIALVGGRGLALCVEENLGEGHEE